MVDFNDRRLGRKASPGYGEKAQAGVDHREYTAQYHAGWRHSATAVNPSLDRSQGQAWEDGYMDHATGREKYALRGHRFGTGDPVEGY
jgi:hypothetical protein